MPSLQANSSPLVAILMCTYNGETYLHEQVDSFYAQTYKNWELWVSDDGSSDATLNIISDYKKRDGHLIHVCNGPQSGFSKNFLSVLEKAESSAKYFAFSDQDDIWNTDKIERAVKWLETIPPDIPALYCSRTELVDSNGMSIGFSPLHTKPADIRNALIENIASGNSMVFNQPARKLILTSRSPFFHDWWAYLIVCAAGGIVYYDPNPSLLYRQHQRNTIGTDKGLGATLKRLLQLWKGKDSHWISLNIAALSDASSHITSDSLNIINQFKTTRELSFAARLLGSIKMKLYKQTRRGTISYFIQIVLKRI